MSQGLNRRDFLAASAGVGAALGLGLRPAPVRADETTFTTKPHKALIREKPSEDELKKLKDAGFEGVEGGVVSPADAAKCRESAAKLGMRIHSVLRGWAEFNSPEKSKVDSTLVHTEAALRAAEAFGADAVLLVPCRVGGMKMPHPWEFLIEFDDKTGHVSRVAVGDNAPYQEYIDAQNRATDTSKEAVKRLIPLAEKTKVIIALENVWNNLWVHPDLFKNFVESFQSPWVRAYFDIGNHVKYVPPEVWVLTLGKLIVKCHVKDFKLNPSDPNGEGEFVDIRDGSIRWPLVRSALEKVGYNGWMTIEGGSLSLEEHSKRLDLILAGK
jgi:hexulose-6-phosphate isomerase